MSRKREKRARVKEQRRQEDNILQHIRPRTAGQSDVFDALSNPQHKYVAVSGPAGTGKSIMGCYFAAKNFIEDNFDKIVICRSITTVQAEDIGYLPGNANAKLGPFMIPLYENLKKFLSPKVFDRMRMRGQLEILPLAYVRGRSLDNCVVLLDEAQNISVEIFKTLLTRINEDSLLIAMGDSDQNDKYRRNVQCDFDKVCDVLSPMESFAHVEMTDEDIVRSPWISEILKRLEPLEDRR